MAEEATGDKELRVADTQQTLEFLQSQGIEFGLTQHEEVHTVDALMQQQAVQQLEGHTLKNLFLRDKKRRLFLLSARHDAAVRLQDLGKQVSGIAGCPRLADESVLLECLGVRQGCVTPLALVNDKVSRVTFLLDAEVTRDPTAKVNCHPVGCNSATVSVTAGDLLKFLTAVEHEPVTVQL